MEPARALDPGDAALLAHALASHVASRAGVRVLIIKGPTAAHHGLREPRVSADADVWVDPAAIDTCLEALRVAGWREREVSETAHDLVVHSVTLIHPDWPCDIDVHCAFPGFLAAPQAVFDALWERRRSMTIAGVDVAIVDRPSAILIAALHALRTPSQTPRHGREIRLLAQKVLPALDAGEQGDLIALASHTGAVDTARPLLARMPADLPPPTPAGVDADLDAWRERTVGAGTPTTQQWQLIRTRPWRERPRLLWRAIWPPEHDFRLDHYEVGPGRAALNRARLARLGRGARAFPGALSAQWRARRGASDAAMLDEQVEP